MKKILAVFFLILYFLFFPRGSFASTIFEDNFDSDLNGTFPSKWNQNDNPGEPHCSVNWAVQNGRVGMPIINQGSCIRNIIPKPELWNYGGQEYIYEVDAEFVQGSNHNIAYRMLPDGQAYELSFSSPGDFVIGGPISNVNVNVPGSYPNGNTYHFEIQVRELNLKVFINGNLVRDIDWSEPLLDGRPGLRAGTGSDPNSTTWFDNFKVSTIQDAPTSSVPLLKQTDPEWGNDVYDSSNLWSSVTGMSRWGCAVTSAAMVFQYNALTKMPDNSNLTPGSLNAWLKTQPDGYIRNGLLNWLALSRLSKQAAPVNGVSFDALEYSRINGRDDIALTNYLNNQNPPILEEPGHFVVATGVDTPNSTFLINDPYYDKTSLADPFYNNDYLRMGTYTPVNSDLSYMMFAVNPYVNITLKDQNGNPVGESYIQDPIRDPLTTAGNSVGPLKIIIYQKPLSGKYTLELTSTNSNPYTLDQYLYDRDGNVKTSSLQGNLGTGITDTFVLNFDKDNTNNTTSELITFDYIKKEIIAGYNQKKIKNFITYAALLAQIEIAKKSRNLKIEKGILDAMSALIKSDKKIDPAFSVILLADIKALKNSL